MVSGYERMQEVEGNIESDSLNVGKCIKVMSRVSNEMFRAILDVHNLGSVSGDSCLFCERCHKFTGVAWQVQGEHEETVHKLVDRLTLASSSAS